MLRSYVISISELNNLKKCVKPLTSTKFKTFPQTYFAITLLIRFKSDHNEDSTTNIVQTWLRSNKELYNKVIFEHQDKPERRSNETSPTHWPEERHLAVIRMKEEALNYARHSWADYVFVSICFLNPYCAS